MHRLRFLSLLYQKNYYIFTISNLHRLYCKISVLPKKDCQGPACQSFFWYDNDKDLKRGIFVAHLRLTLNSQRLLQSLLQCAIDRKLTCGFFSSFSQNCIFGLAYLICTPLIPRSTCQAKLIQIYLQNPIEHLSGSCWIIIYERYDHRNLFRTYWVE